tara:strand:- start:165 stop:1148 length:984 start_codon:yes stop_codon:yes gene_type:complete
VIIAGFLTLNWDKIDLMNQAPHDSNNKVLVEDTVTSSKKKETDEDKNKQSEANKNNQSEANKKKSTSADPKEAVDSKTEEEGGKKALSTDVLIYAILGLSIALVLSIWITFYLYRWRRILSSKPHLLMPEEFGTELMKYNKTINTFGKYLEQLGNFENENASKLNKKSDKLVNKMDSLIETYMTLQGSINSKDEEIQRLKAGYDAEIFKRFLYRFLRVHRTLIELERDEQFDENQRSLIKSLLEDAIDECGVEEFSPDIGGDIRVIEGIADNPKKRTVNSKADEFKVLEVIEPGYRIRVQNGKYQTIVEAKVIIGVLQEEQKNEGTS